jgi:hypothetical protein
MCKYGAQQVLPNKESQRVATTIYLINKEGDEEWGNAGLDGKLCLDAYNMTFDAVNYIYKQ